MKTILKSSVILFLAGLLLLQPALALETIFELVDESGTVVTKTSLELSAGDVYIASDNSEYEVIGKEDGKFKVKKTGVVDLSIYLNRPLTIKVEGSKPLIGIYHTHSDESYAPGNPSQPYPGEIYQVGKALKEALEARGFQVEWSQANHNPHDGAAYNRSRDTAAKLLRSNPITLIDVHRDAVPDAEFYTAQIDGQPVAKVRIVAGKQNQNKTSNFEYAKALKAKADKDYPGIMEGIFWAKGNYNQDLGPRTILLEFGTHVLTLDQAKMSAEKFADAITAALPEGGGSLERAASKRAIFWVVLIAIAGVAIFLVINKEGLSGFKNLGRKLTHALRLKGKDKC